MMKRARDDLESQLAEARAERARKWARAERSPPRSQVEYMDYGVVVLRGFFRQNRKALAGAIAGTNSPRNEIRCRRSGTVWIHVRDATSLRRFRDLGFPAWREFLGVFDEARWRRSRGVDGADTFPRDLLKDEYEVTANVFDSATQELGFHVDKIGRRQKGYRSDWLVNVNLGARGALHYYFRGTDGDKGQASAKTVVLDDGDAVLFDGNHLTHRVALDDPQATPRADLPPWNGRRPVRLSLQLRARGITRGPRSVRGHAPW